MQISIIFNVIAYLLELIIIGKRIFGDKNIILFGFYR